MAENVIFAEQTLGFGYNSSFGVYANPANNLAFVFTEGQEYVVAWDGETYARTAFSFTAADGSACVAVGNPLVAAQESNGDLFAIVCDTTNNYLHFLSLEMVDTHTIAIYQIVEDEEPEEPPTEEPLVGIILKDQSGNDVVYEGVKTIVLNTSDGGTQAFSRGEAMEGIEIAPDFSNGDQTITAPKGTLVKSAVIKQPNNLTAENVRYGVDIAGVTGEFIGDTEEATVDLDMADGDQVVVPSAYGKVLSKVTVTKPETLIPDNIKKDVEIAGIVGTYSMELDLEALKYFAYQVDAENGIIIVSAIFWSQIYADTGSYDITVPDSASGFDIVIESEGVI